MPLEDVTSVAMAKEKARSYTQRRPRVIAQSSRYWKLKLPPKKQPVWVRTEKNFWDNRLNYFIYVILLGNTVDGFPLVFRFSLEVSGVTMVMLLLLNSFILVMPIMYMEIFLGKYTKLTNSQMYRMTPIFFGFSILILITNAIYAPFRSTDINLFLIAVLNILINPDYGMACPKNSPGCFHDAKFFENKSTQHCTYEYMAIQIDGKNYRYVHEYLYWSTFKDLDGENYPVATCVIASIITWIFIILFCMLGMKILGLILRGTFVIHTIMYTVIFLMAITTKGAFDGLERLTEFKLYQPRLSEVVMLAFFTTSKMGLLVPSGYMTSTACSKYKTTMDPGYECLVLSLCNNALTMYYLLIVYAVGGVMINIIGFPLNCTIVPFAGLYYAFIPEFLKIRECPDIILVVYHLSNWFLEVVRLALGLHLLILNVYDFLPKFANYQSYVKIMVGFGSAVLSIIFSFKIFTIVLIPTYNILCCYFLNGFCLLIMSVMVFYFYGVNRLNDDIHFVTGRRPIKYWRILWYMYPIMFILGLLVVGVGEFEREEQVGLRKDLPQHPIVQNIGIVGISICAFFSCVVLFSTFFYIVVGIKSSTTIMNLLKPQFHWGPPNKELRVTRKSFAPRSSIRSQPLKKKKQRFRVKSIKQMHERDAARHVKHGRIFLDAMFFTNIGNSGVKKY